MRESISKADKDSLEVLINAFEKLTKAEMITVAELPGKDMDNDNQHWFAGNHTNADVNALRASLALYKLSQLIKDRSDKLPLVTIDLSADILLNKVYGSLILEQLLLLTGTVESTLVPVTVVLPEEFILNNHNLHLLDCVDNLLLLSIREETIDRLDSYKEGNFRFFDFEKDFVRDLHQDQALFKMRGGSYLINFDKTLTDKELEILYDGMDKNFKLYNYLDNYRPTVAEGKLK